MGRVERSVEVNAPVEVCYELWTDFENFPRFMKNVRQIRHKGSENVWHWEVEGPLGKVMEWDAEVDSLQPNKAVSWHSVRNAHVQNSGAVTFKELGNGMTRIDVVMVYDPPAGAVGEFVADVFKNPDRMVQEDLDNFKQLAEENRDILGTGMAGVTTGNIDSELMENRSFDNIPGAERPVGRMDITDDPNRPTYMDPIGGQTNIAEQDQDDLTAEDIDPLGRSADQRGIFRPDSDRYGI